MKKIVRGNDFTLKVAVRKVTGGEKVRFPLPAATDIEVNLVNAYRRYALAYSIGVDDDSSLEARVETQRLPLGSYALEVKGRLWGMAWRSNEYEQLCIVDNNASGDTELGGADEGESSVEMDTAIVVLPPTAELGQLIEGAHGAAADALAAAEAARAAADAATATADAAAAAAKRTAGEAAATALAATERAVAAAERATAAAAAAKQTSEEAAATAAATAGAAAEEAKQTAEEAAATATATANTAAADAKRTAGEAADAARAAAERAVAAAERAESLAVDIDAGTGEIVLRME